MATKLLRRDIGYTIISRFETYLRAFINDKINVFHSTYEDGVPEGIKLKASERNSDEHFSDFLEFLDNTDFPDLKEIIQFNSSYDNYFDSGDLPQNKFNEVMDELYILRCKIAHINGYFTSMDLDALIELCCIIANQLKDFGNEFKSFIQELETNPNEIVLQMPLSFAEEKQFQNLIPNNLPTPDYEFEGGFIGREKDIKSAHPTNAYLMVCRA